MGRYGKSKLCVTGDRVNRLVFFPDKVLVLTEDRMIGGVNESSNSGGSGRRVVVSEQVNDRSALK